ncbi:MAG: DUF4298 domain-containing protein [Lautropia sp.]|nr:DUF4298 domain-containing protein [Lautropia sp.]
MVKNDPSDPGVNGSATPLPGVALARIQRLEALYNEWAELLPGLQLAQQQWQQARERLQVLRQYYFEGEWRSDFAADEAGRIPDGVRRGILTEDTLYNAFIAERELALTWVQLGAAALKDV